MTTDDRTATPTPPMTQEIPAPSDFPIEWDRPEDAQRFWERELMHVPQQATILDDAFMQLAVVEGFNRGCEAYDMPVRNAYRRVNTYEYQSIAPVSREPAELEEVGRRCHEKLGAVFGRQLDLWEDEWLPEITRYLADWEGFDRAGSSAPELLGHFDQTLARAARSWEIHFLVLFPVIFSISLFDDLHQRLLGSGNAIESFKLLQGFPNHTTEADRALYELSRRAAVSPNVLSALQRSNPVDVREALSASPAGRTFLANLDSFLDTYGRRQDGYISISEASWCEEPAVVFTALRNNASQPERAPRAKLAELAREREHLVAAARTRLTGFPADAVREFELLLDAAQQGSIMQENHNFWIDGKVIFSVRRVVREAGRRLTEAGLVEAPEDVFHLTIEEIREGLGGLARDLRGEVADRKAVIELYANIRAPAVLGTSPSTPPPNDPLTRAIFKLFGGPTDQSEKSTVIKGLAGSSGVARGPARIIRSLAEAARLEHGDVLIATTTSPPWTALFATAAAVVTDVGGSLSHCALVARECMIPAVVGTRIATASISDGQLVEVDGNEGVVRIIEE